MDAIRRTDTRASHPIDDAQARARDTRPAADHSPRLGAGVARVLESYRPALKSIAAARVAHPAPVSQSEVQQKLDAFQDRMNASYSVGGESVRVTPGFRMNGGHGPTVKEARSAIIGKLPRGAVPLATIGFVISGKGTPEQIQRVTQALIDAGALSDFPAADSAQSIRKLMFAYGIGCDCSGYSYQAFAAVRGTRFNPDVPPGRRVSTDARDAKPGDVIRLVAANGRHGVGSGHKVIVYSHETLPKGSPPPRFAGRPPVPTEFMTGGPVHVFELDSSWGGGPRGEHGGVGRGVWLFNESSGKWAHFSPSSGRFTLSPPGPYDHVLEGVYR